MLTVNRMHLNYSQTALSFKASSADRGFNAVSSMAKPGAAILRWKRTTFSLSLSRFWKTQIVGTGWASHTSLWRNCSMHQDTVVRHARCRGVTQRNPSLPMLEKPGDMGRYSARSSADHLCISTIYIDCRNLLAKSWLRQ